MMDQRTAITTGANSGIGLATVLELARRGFRSVGTVRSETKATAVAEAHRAGLTVETVLLDVTEPEHCALSLDRFRGTRVGGTPTRASRDGGAGL
jgi:NAD(P)-dependent dehydrogenase (short-subunit alcohol dehydrogenase family)